MSRRTRRPHPKQMGVLKNAPYQIPWLGLGRTLNPNLDTGTEGLGTWRELHDALRDPKAAACLDLRCQVVADLPWNLVPRPETPPEAVDLVRRALEGLNLVEDIEEMAKAAYYGLVPLEVHWDLVKGDLVPVDLESFEPIHLSFDPDRQPLIAGRPAGLGKLILHRHGSHFRNPWGLGRGRTIPRWVRVKVAIAYATYRDYPRFAHDRIVFRYPDGTQDDEQARYIEIAGKLMDSPGVVIPDGMTAERLELDNTFEVGVKLLDAADAQIAVGILGNTLTTGEGQHGTQALGGVHQGQSDRQESADARRIEATLNRTLIPWIVAVNLGPEVQAPLFRFEKQVRASLKERLEAVTALKQQGLEPSTIWLRETFGIPAPQDEADELEPEEKHPGLPSAGTGAGAPGKPAASPGPDDEEALLSDPSQEPADAMLARWADGYVRRQGVVGQLLAASLHEARDFGQAWTAAMALAKDFPVSAGEGLFTAMQAARDLGAYEAELEARALQLEDGPAIDFDMVPDQALAWLRGKLPLTFDQVEGLKDAELRARAFWVAGVDQLGLLTDLQQSMAGALSAGTPFDEWKASWLGRLSGVGVTEERLRLAFDTQVHAAYMGGRMTGLQANPLVQTLTYVTAGDESVRPAHRILNGVTRPKGDPFWATHTPPLGFRCRCRIRAAEKGRPETQSHDPRLQTPPESGFGQGAPSFARYLETQAREPLAWKPIPAGSLAWAWLDRTAPAPMPPAPAPPRMTSSGDLVTDPTGRVVAAPSANQQVLDALQSPAEIWLAPVEGPEGQLGLQLNYLISLPHDQVLLVPVQGGIVPRAQGVQVLSDPAPWRRGVRLR